MRSRDVVGKRIVSVWNEVVGTDPDYYGPRVVCSQITLEDGTRLVAHSYESSAEPISNISAVKPERKQRTKNERHLL